MRFHPVNGWVSQGGVALYSEDFMCTSSVEVSVNQRC